MDAALDLIQGINLNLIFSLSNNGLLPVYIPDLSYDISINDIPIGSGYSDINIRINPGQTEEIVSFQNIQKSSLSPAANSIVSADGIIDLKVKGTAYFELLWSDIPIPFESSRQISIYDEIRNKIDTEIQKNQEQSIDYSDEESGNVLRSLANEVFGAEDLDLTLPGEYFIDSTYRIKPASYYSIEFTLKCTANLQGGFISSAALGDSIIVYILDENKFSEFEKGRSVSAFYNSGKVESDEFDISLTPGKYFIVMSNTYSTISTKTVQLQVAGTCI